jgi:hypothetical protein
MGSLTKKTQTIRDRKLAKLQANKLKKLYKESKKNKNGK